MSLPGAHVVLLGTDSAGLTQHLASQWEQAFPDIDLRVFDNGQTLKEWASTLPSTEHILMGMVTSEIQKIDEELQNIDQIPLLHNTQWLVITDKDIHDDLHTLASAGHLAAVMPAPCKQQLFIGQVHAVLVSYLRNAGFSSEKILATLGAAPLEAVQGLLLPGLDRDEQEVVRELLAGVERVIGPRPRILMPEGVDLTRQNTSIAAVHLVLEGQVILRRETERGELIFHHATSGVLIGLVSLTRNEEAFFTSTTTTPTRVVQLTNEQLRLVLDEEPELAKTLAVLAIKSLSRRLIRAEDLHMENAVLAEDLEEERSELQQALDDLKRTREELVERTRFAMLGELSAGIAHELNNPVTALLRSAEHLGQDIEQLLSGSDAMKAAHGALIRMKTAQIRSTSTERELVRTLHEAVGDRHLARRLVQAGINEPQEAVALLKKGEKELALVEQGARVGNALRSVLSASERVIGLTKSLKGYARPDSEEMKPCDVREGIDDALRLTHHRLHGVSVECHYDEIPLVCVHPAKLQQVWTNLLVNAAEAIEDEREDAAQQGSLPIRGETEARIIVAAQHIGNDVHISINDNGPGIPTEVQQRMFEPHFTTKAGRVRYGLGMGMSISRSIVEDMGGRMNVHSTPGNTTITVTLPITAPSDHQEETP